MHRLLNDAELVKLPDEKNSSSGEPLDLSLPTATIPSATSSRLGYVELPPKYVPSTDPARQQVSMKLSKIYEREIGQSSALQAHRAEDDCLMLLAVLKRYLPDWLDWIETHTQSLNDFSTMPSSSTIQNSSKIFVKVKRPFKF